MLCPTCDNVHLAMSDRQGIEIDYCPQCRGIWLDRGELDQLIERAERVRRTSLPPRHRHTYAITHVPTTNASANATATGPATTS